MDEKATSPYRDHPHLTLEDLERNRHLPPTCVFKPATPPLFRTPTLRHVPFHLRLLASAAAFFGLLLLMPCLISHHPHVNLSSLRAFAPFPAAKNPDITPLATLDDSLLPTPQNKRRLLIIGDIHGSIAPLDALLNKTNYDPATDHLITTGDAIAKGPDTPAVLSRLADLNATPVRGNHEDKLIRAARALGRFDTPKPEQGPYDLASAQAAVQAQLSADGGDVNPGAEELAKTLPLGTLEAVRQWPVMLELGHLSLSTSQHEGVGSVKSVVVHGGLLPGVRLREQQLEDVMEMRTLRRQEVGVLGGVVTDEQMEEEERKRGKGGKGGKGKGKGKAQWRWVPSPDPNVGAQWHHIWFEEQELAFAEWRARHPRSGTVPEDEVWDMDKARESFQRAVEGEEEGGYDSAGDDVDAEKKKPKGGKKGHKGKGKGKGKPWWKKGGRGGEIDEHLEAMRCIYGHDSKVGLMQRKWSTGLDGGCVSGGRLHALVVEAGGKETVVSVDC